MRDSATEKGPILRISNGTPVVVTNSISGRQVYGRIVGANEEPSRVWWYYVEKEDGSQVEALPSIVEEA